MTSLRKQAREILEAADRLVGLGNTYFVDSVHGNSGNSGLTPNEAFDSIVNAIATQQLNPQVGDTIVCLQTHAEPVITSAGQITIPANVEVVSLGRGNQRAKLTFSTATTASVLMSGAGAALRNFQIDCTGIDALANPVNVTAADCEITDCAFTLANSTGQAVAAIVSSAAANRLKVRRNRIIGSSDAGATTGVKIVGGDAIEVTNNVISGAFGAGVGGIQVVTTDATNILVEYNRVNNVTASSTKAIVATTSTTGFVGNNSMNILSGTAPVTAAGCCLADYGEYAAAVGTAGSAI